MSNVAPNSTIASEWDVLAEIWATLEPYRKQDRPKFAWEKGHQDKKKPFHKLSLRAQLNVEADQLADEFLLNNPTIYYPRAHVFPTSGIQLRISTGTINRKIKKELRTARTEGALIDNICDRFDWDYSTFKSVDWEAHRVALNQLNKHRVSLTKHIHAQAPTGKIAHRNDPKYSPACPSCPEQEEDWHHLMVCPGRHEWRVQCQKKVREKLEEWDTSFDLIELLLAGIKALFNGEVLSPTDYSGTVASLAAQQEAIGWNQLFCGRIATAWGQHQHKHLGNKITEKNNGQTWSNKVTKLLLEQWLEMWWERNGDRHGRDHASRQQAKREQAQREVEQLYKLKEDIEDQYKWIFRIPLEQKLTSATHVLRAWINNYEPILRRSVEYQTRLETG